MMVAILVFQYEESATIWMVLVCKNYSNDVMEVILD